MPRIYKDGVLYNTSPSTASQLPYDNNTSTKDKIDSKMDKANPTGTGSLSLNKLSGSTLGPNSVSIGQNNTASGDQSFAEGRENIASGNQSHAEGYQTTASMTRAHSEGSNTVASGTASHAEGSNTIANHLCQHVFGEYNLADTSTAQPSSRGNYVEIVGKGTGNNSRSNARTLDWSGNEVLAGGLKINGNQDVIPYASGSVTIPSIIAAGYITASGNYIDINVPILTAPNASISVISFNNSMTGIYISTGKLTNALDTNFASVTRISESFVRIEFKFTSTQTANQMATMNLTNLVLSIT